MTSRTGKEGRRARATLERGTLDRRGETWRWRVRLDGERMSFTIASPDGLPLDRRGAVDAANRRLAELTSPESTRERRRRRAVGLDGSVRMSALLDEYDRGLDGPRDGKQLAPGTVATYRDQLKLIREWFAGPAGDPAVEDVRPLHVRDYLAWRAVNRRDGLVTQGRRRASSAPPPLSARSVNKDRALLHAVFALAEDREYRQGNPVARTRQRTTDKKDYVILDEPQYDALVGVCEDPMLRLYVLVLGETGCRSMSEALRLRWEDVDLEGGFLRIVSGRDGHRTKAGKSRWTPITPRLDSALRDHLAAFRFAGSPWVFHHVRGSERGQRVKAARIGSLRRGFKAAAERAGLPRALRQHDLRHRRVTTWLAEGQNPVHVKEAVGHSDLRTTMGYTHLTRDHLRALAEPVRPPRAAAV